MSFIPTQKNISSNLLTGSDLTRFYKQKDFLTKSLNKYELLS